MGRAQGEGSKRAWGGGYKGSGRDGERLCGGRGVDMGFRKIGKRGLDTPV